MWTTEIAISNNCISIVLLKQNFEQNTAHEPQKAVTWLFNKIIGNNDLKLNLEDIAFQRNMKK